MLDLIYKTLLTIINKENKGYISPVEFNILANKVQEEIFINYFDDETINKNKKNKGLLNKGYANLDFINRQQIDKFSEIVRIDKTDGIFKLPLDLYFIEDDGVRYIYNPDCTPLEYTKIIEEVEKSNINYLNSSLSKPSITFPIYEIFSKHIKVYPSLISDIEIRYIRKPKKPQWTYFVLNNGSEVFDPSNSSFQDIELHDSEFSNIVNRMLTYFGINLREPEVVKIAENLKDKSSSDWKSNYKLNTNS